MRNDNLARFRITSYNGNHYDNRLENLQILCPSCHAIQPGNAGANIGKHSNL